MINYNGKRFRVKQNSDNGELSSDTIFEYAQQNNMVFCLYKGVTVQKGQLLGIVNSDGSINMAYQQINQKGELLTGTCISRPEVMKNGKIRLYESWKWTSGDYTEGSSILEEI